MQWETAPIFIFPDTLPNSVCFPRDMSNFAPAFLSTMIVLPWNYQHHQELPTPPQTEASESEPKISFCSLCRRSLVACLSDWKCDALYVSNCSICWKNSPLYWMAQFYFCGICALNNYLKLGVVIWNHRNRLSMKIISQNIRLPTTCSTRINWEPWKFGGDWKIIA